MNQIEIFRVELTLEEAEALNGSLFKPQTAMVCEKIQKQIIDALDIIKTQDDDFYIAKYHQQPLNFEK